MDMNVVEDEDEDMVRETVRSYDAIARPYCKKTRRPQFLRWERTYLEKLLSHLSVKEPRVLDIGCGDGRHCTIIDDRGGVAVGIDRSRAMLREAKAHYPGGHYLQMDMRQLAFGAQRVHALWASGSIYHLPKVELGAALAAFHRVLEPGGALAVSFKIGTGEGMEAHPHSYDGKPRFFAYYTADEMSARCEMAGFVELERCRYPEAVYGDALCQMWFCRKGM